VERRVAAESGRFGHQGGYWRVPIDTMFSSLAIEPRPDLWTPFP
jgi:hypothetical protein